MTTLTFEDFKPGRFGTFGPRRVTREEILEFAGEFDPQPMHLDEEAAKRSMLKGLSGSGWHLCSVMMRLLFDGFIGAARERAEGRNPQLIHLDEDEIVDEARSGAAARQG